MENMENMENMESMKNMKNMENTENMEKVGKHQPYDLRYSIFYSNPLLRLKAFFLETR